MVPAMVIGSGRASSVSFGDPVPLEATASEPVIEVGPGGTVFVSGIYGVGGHSPLWRSDDQAASFNPVDFGTVYKRLPGGGDSDLVLGRDRRVYFLDLWAGSNSIAHSEDNGATWIDGTPFTTLPVSDRQWVALGKRDARTGKDTVYVVYHLIQPPQSIAFSRSRDGGLTWDLPVLPAGTGGALPGQIVADGDFVAFNYHAGNTMFFVYSRDAGTTWTTVKVTERPDVFEGNLTAVAMDPARRDDLAIAWINRRDFSVEVARSSDRGLRWGTPVRVSVDGKSNVFPWIDARKGKVAVAWYGANQPGDPNAVTGDWRVRYAESTDHGATFGRPVDATEVVKRGAVCTNGVLCESGRELGDFLQVAVDLGGRSLISYVDLVNGTSVVRQGPL